MEVVRPGRSEIQERPQGPDIGLGLRSSLLVSAIPGMDAPTLVPGLEGGMDPSSPVQLEPVLEVDPPVRGWDRVCFLLWSPGTWGELMLTDGHFFSLSVSWLVGWYGVASWYGVDVAGRGPVGCSVTSGPTILTPCRNESEPGDSDMCSPEITIIVY